MNTEPTCHTGHDDPIDVEINYEYADTHNPHVELLATFDDGRPPIRLTFDPLRAGNVASLLQKAVAKWDEHNYEQGMAIGLLMSLEDDEGQNRS